MSQDLIAIALTHHTAPVEIREQVALSEREISTLLLRLKGGIAREAIIVSTCNRTELYALPADPSITADYLIEFLLTEKHERYHAERIAPLFQRLSYCDAITHLFAVISGIDSQIIGDQQIFSQVKESFRLSTEAQASGTFMTRLAHAAFHVAKRVRTETSITNGAATISYAAVEFARKIYDDFRDRRALIIGAGETAELAAKHLVERNIGTLRVANRSIENGSAMLANVRGGHLQAADQVHGLDDLVAALANSDIVISSTGATDYVVTPKMVEAASRKRQSPYPLILIDIAVPRDIDPKVAKLSNVFLKTIDYLRSIVDQNLAKRKSELPTVQAIISDELERFLAAQSVLEVGPTIKELRERFETIRHEELERHGHKLDDKSRALVEEMTRRMINRLLHKPTIMLKEPRASLDDVMTKIELVRALFELDSDEASHDNSSGG